MKNGVWYLLVGLVFLALSGELRAEKEIGPEDDLRRAVEALVPGDELVLRGGSYVLDGNLTFTVEGSPRAPIVIRSREGEKPVLLQGSDRHNVLEVRSSQYLVLRGLTFTGGSHGIRLIDSDDITIEDCEVYETGDVAISANSGGTYNRLKILRNHIHHTNGTGEGMYLGCNNNQCRIANSLIEGNYIHHTNRSTVEQGDGIEIKEGSYGNTIRDNVIHDTKYPAILTYSTRGNGAPNMIEGNVIWNSSDNTLQVAADAIIRNNIILGNVAFQRHQSGRPSNIEFVYNTVVNSESAIAVRDVGGPVLIANNAVYSRSAAIRLLSGNLRKVTMAGNVVQGRVTGSRSGYLESKGVEFDIVGGNFRGEPPFSVFPAPGSTMIGAAADDHFTARDFNGNMRESSNDAGAYAYHADGNPGWTIGKGFKQSIADDWLFR